MTVVRGRVGVCVMGLVYVEVRTPADFHRPSPDREVFVHGLELGLGGALNTASVATALGESTTLACPAGPSPFDQVALEEARRLGLTVLAWPASTGPPISVVFDGAGNRSFLSTANFDSLRQCPPLPVRGWIHVAGLREARLAGGRLGEARARGARISVAAAWTPEELRRLADAPARVYDLLVLSEAEAAVVAHDPEAAIRRLRGAAEEVVVTSADRAVAWLDGRMRVVEHEPVADIVDTTGAGDAYCAGLLYARSRAAEWRTALEFAGSVASRVLRISGGTVGDPALFDGLEA